MSESRASLKKCPEFLCHIKFKNSLPEPAVDSKLLVTSADLSGYASYRLSSIEQAHQFEVPFDVMQLPMLDMVDLDMFKPGVNEYLGAEDELLVRGGTSGGGAKDRDVGRGTPQAKGQRTDVTWLRRTEYLSSETKNKGAAPSMATVPDKRVETKLETPADAVRSIETSFQFRPVPENLHHPTKPTVKATAIYPIVPTSMSPALYAHCSFDADPLVKSVDGIKVSPQGDQHALIKAMSNAEDPEDTFVYYYLPSEGEADKFVYSRDYDIQRIERQAHSYYILSVPSEAAEDKQREAAFYTPISGNFHLKKRRAKTDHSRQRHSLKVLRID